MAASALLLELTIDTDSGRPATTRSVTVGAARVFLDLGYAPLMEVGLPNGRRADVMAVGRNGQIVICEVKSCVEDLRADGKWPDYRPYCDALYFAVPTDFPLACLPEGQGRIVADRFGGAVIQPAIEHRLAPARRRALTIALARLGGFRLLRDQTGG